MVFKRKFTKEAIEQLIKEDLFNEKLKNDVIKGDGKTHCVFPAIRDNRIDFYWGGRNLFSYSLKSGFRSHHKYASVIFDEFGVPDNKKDSYIRELSLKNDSVRLIQNFSEGYDRIKENCRHYSGVEALGVSSLYERFSCAKSSTELGVVVLDIEASFTSNVNGGDSWGGSKRKKQDRIDLVIFDLKNSTLRFIEAKHYNNKEIRSDGTPAVVYQMEKYSKQIKDNKVDILEAYQNHVDIINILFRPNNKLHKPKYVEEEPILLIFGFDEAQRNHYLKKEIEPKLKRNNLRFYSIGEIKNSKLSTIFKGGKQNWD